MRVLRWFGRAGLVAVTAFGGTAIAAVMLYGAVYTAALAVGGF